MIVIIFSMESLRFLLLSVESDSAELLGGAEERGGKVELLGFFAHGGHYIVLCFACLVVGR